ncbi:MAG: PAS domain-containing protein [Phormidium tanganyikae FI6-MK23]|jgi:PAS domain S-box-containing protein|nr:PAS domain-containing protein [Phormidium tanganyikae FI6-MK23]
MVVDELFDLNERRNVYISPQIFPMLGVLPADVQVLDSQVLAELFHPDDLERIEQHHDRIRVAQEDDIFTLEYRMKHSSGKWLWLSSRDTIFVRDAQGKPTQILGSAIDITVAKHLEEGRKQAEAEGKQFLAREQAAREQAEQANRIKDEFLAVLSHELRSPLNPVLGWTRLLQNGKLDAARQAEVLKTIERNAKLQTQLIEDLLDISRIMQGKLSLTAAPVSLAFVITVAVETVQLAAEAKHIQILLDLTTAIPPVIGDAARLQQVLDQFIPDVLVSNVGMAEMNGYMLIQQIRSCPPDKGGQIPAIALSAYASNFDQQQALRVGFQRHLAKPIEPDELILAVAMLTQRNTNASDKATTNLFVEGLDNDR